KTSIRIDHITEGGIKNAEVKSGDATYLVKVGTGGHLESESVRVDKIIGGADRNGVRKAYVSIQDQATGQYVRKVRIDNGVVKPIMTTLFPEAWLKAPGRIER